MRGATSPDGRAAAPGLLRFGDKKQTASMLVLRAQFVIPAKSGYPGAMTRGRKSGPLIGARKVRLRERGGLLDSRVRGNDM
jgi:hypothetical protein